MVNIPNVSSFYGYYLVIIVFFMCGLILNTFSRRWIPKFMFRTKSMFMMSP